MGARVDKMLLLLCACLCISLCQGAFYLPGVTPVSYEAGQGVSVKANKVSYASHQSRYLVHSMFLFKVTSTKTPLQFDYYDLPFCKRPKTKFVAVSCPSLLRNDTVFFMLRSRAGNIGERIGGDALTTSPYELRVKQDEACVVLCRKVLTDP
jgi:hypothetical protein